MKFRETQRKLNNISIWNADNIKFIKNDHKYLINGNPTISTSDIIRRMRTPEQNEFFNSKCFQNYLEPYKKFGTLIHNLTEKFDYGTSWKELQKIFENESNKKDIKICLKKYIEILNNNNIFNNYKIFAIELPIYSKKYNFCGTLDRLIFDFERNRIIIADIKTGKNSNTYWIQQLLYAEILKEWDILVNEIAIISLKDEPNIQLFHQLPIKKQQKLIKIKDDLLTEQKQIKGGKYA